MYEGAGRGWPLAVKNFPFGRQPRKQSCSSAWQGHVGILRLAAPLVSALWRSGALAPGPTPDEGTTSPPPSSQWHGVERAPLR